MLLTSMLLNAATTASAVLLCGEMVMVGVCSELWCRGQRKGFWKLSWVWRARPFCEEDASLSLSIQTGKKWKKWKSCQLTSITSRINFDTSFDWITALRVSENPTLSFNDLRHYFPLEYIPPADDVSIGLCN